MRIGEKISLIRKRKGLTQSDLASKLGKTPQWLSNIERGTRSIGTDELEEVSKVLGISPGVFFAENFNDTLKTCQRSKPQSA